MKKIYLLLITSLLTITLCITNVSATNGNEIIPFHPDPSLITEWDVSELGDTLDFVEFDTAILKIIIGVDDVTLRINNVNGNALGECILWLCHTYNGYTYTEIIYTNSTFDTIWLGGGQSTIPNMHITHFGIVDENDLIKDIYIYPDAYIDITDISSNNNVNLYSYNFEYELDSKYQLGYNEGWGEKNKMTDITFLIIGLIIFIIANTIGLIFNNTLLITLAGLLWFIPIFLVDNIFIRLFSGAIMLITFLYNTRKRDDY